MTSWGCVEEAEEAKEEGGAATVCGGAISGKLKGAMPFMGCRCGGSRPCSMLEPLAAGDVGTDSDGGDDCM